MIGIKENMENDNDCSVSTTSSHGVVVEARLGTIMTPGWQQYYCQGSGVAIDI
jgi:hypothetical protein